MKHQKDIVTPREFLLGVAAECDAKGAKELADGMRFLAEGFAKLERQLAEVTRERDELRQVVEQQAAVAAEYDANRLALWNQLKEAEKQRDEALAAAEKSASDAECYRVSSETWRDNHAHVVRKLDEVTKELEAVRWGARKLVEHWRECAHDLRVDGLGMAAEAYEERAAELEEVVAEQKAGSDGSG